MSNEQHTPTRATVSSLPTHSGDGYGYGGGAILTIGDLSILLGEGSEAHTLANTIAARWNSHEALVEVVKAFIAEQVDYMTRNKLGDPEKQHNVKWARSVLAKAES